MHDMRAMNTMKEMQLSQKAGLLYDSGWYRDGRVHETIENCTSSPGISADLFLRRLHQFDSFSESDDERNDLDSTGVFDMPTCNVGHRDGAQDVSSGTAARQPISTEIEMLTANLQTIRLESDQTSTVESSIQTCREQWDKLSKLRAAEHRRMLQKHCKQLLTQTDLSCTLIFEQQDETKSMLFENIKNVEQENEEMRQQRLQNQRDRYNLHVKRMEVKLKTALQKKAEAEVEAEHNRRIAEMQAYLESMSKVHKQIDESSKKISQQLTRCKHQDFLPPEADEIKKRVEALAQRAVQLLNDAVLRGASMDLVESMHSIIEALMVHQENASKVIVVAERSAQETTARKARDASLAQQQAAVATATAHANANEEHDNKTVRHQSTTPEGTGDSVLMLQRAIAAEALTEYEKSKKKLKEVTDICQTLTKTADARMKKYRFDLQKAVNVPVNAISNQSGSHLLDKLRRLRSLLSGENVEVTGRKVSVPQKSEANAFVKDLLAQKIVKQSDEQVSSNYESAFPFATVAVALWCDFPDLGKLILAHFYTKCPFLVPCYITKSQDQSTEEYYKSIGYKYDSDGVIEQQDKYLRRMSGYMRLYAAIMISQPVHKRQDHLHGIDYAWRWLARSLNMDPQPDITATMLFDFLETIKMQLTTEQRVFVVTEWLRTWREWHGQENADQRHLLLAGARLPVLNHSVTTNTRCSVVSCILLVCGHVLAAAYNRQFFKLIKILYKSYFPKIYAVTPKGSGGPVTRLRTFIEDILRTHRISKPKGMLSSDFWRM